MNLSWQRLLASVAEAVAEKLTAQRVGTGNIEHKEIDHAETMKQPEQIFTDKVLATLFPPERSNDFFDALFGDASEGAYDIVLTFDGYEQSEQTLQFNLNLHERPGRCLACNLTYGLPDVFSRHPIINIKGLVAEIERLLGGEMVCGAWQLGRTEQKGRSLHVIPLQIQLKKP